MVDRVVVEIERGKRGERGERERKEGGRRRVNVVLERGTETRPHGSSVSPETAHTKSNLPYLPGTYKSDTHRVTVG